MNSKEKNAIYLLMNIEIIDYNAGNLQSVYNAIYNLGYNPSIIKDYK